MEIVDEVKKAEKEAKKRKRYAHIYYKPFSTYKNLNDWHYQLEMGENIEATALGTGWVAVVTSMGYVRVFSTEGIQRYIFCQGMQVLTVAGYENLLVLVYHSAPAFYGQQALKVKIIDVGAKSYQIINDIECPITRSSTLSWLGFSDEGQLFTLDTEGVLRALNPHNMLWVPVLNFRTEKMTNYSNIWMVGISENDVMAIEVAKGYAVPHINLKSRVRRFKIKYPFLDQESKDPDSKEMSLSQLEQEIFKLQQQIDFEQSRKDTWEHLKHFRTKYDTEYVQTETILGKTELQQKKKELDKAIIGAIRICVMSSDHEKVFAYMNMINFTQTLKICVNFCDSVNASELAQKISKFIQDKEQKEIMLGTFKDQHNSSH